MVILINLLLDDVGIARCDFYFRIQIRVGHCKRWASLYRRSGQRMDNYHWRGKLLVLHRLLVMYIVDFIAWHTHSTGLICHTHSSTKIADS